MALYFIMIFIIIVALVSVGTREIGRLAYAIPLRLLNLRRPLPLAYQGTRCIP